MGNNKLHNRYYILVLIVAFLIILCFEVLLFFGIVMGNMMSCDNSGQYCSKFALVATGVYMLTCLIVPMFAINWVLKAAPTTRNKIKAFLIIIIGPVIAIIANMAILIIGSLFR